MNDMKGEEVPITTLDNLNKKVFVCYEDANRNYDKSLNCFQQNK